MNIEAPNTEIGLALRFNAFAVQDPLIPDEQLKPDGPHMSPSGRRNTGGRRNVFDTVQRKQVTKMPTR